MVDDESEVASVLADLLKIDGHRVDTAWSGLAALAKLREKAYDLVLSDVKMPELDGMGLYQETSCRHPHLARRFVFLTGDRLSPDTGRLLEHMERCRSVAKPFDLSEVRLAVQQALLRR